ncbi:MAG: hypothetical protein ACM3X6_00340 [Patescibacteria group bacterium]
MSKRITTCLLVCLAIPAVGAFSPGVWADQPMKIELICIDQNIGTAAPSDREQDFYLQYPAMQQTDFSPWRVDYVGRDMGNVSMDISAVAETNFTDGAGHTVTVADHLYWAEYIASGPSQGLQPYVTAIYNPTHSIPLPTLSPPDASRVVSKLVVRHSQNNPVPMYLKLHLHGDEPPGTYSATFYTEAGFVTP